METSQMALHRQKREKERKQRRQKQHAARRQQREQRKREQSREGDYVLWADASKYHSTQLPAHSVTRAIAALASIGNGDAAAANR